MKKTVLYLLLGVGLIGGFSLLRPPDGLSLEAWRLFGLFLITIFFLVLRPFPEPVILILSITATGFLSIPLQDLLIGYTDSILWLTITAMIMSIGLKKSGLTERAALGLIHRFGRTSLRLGYIVSFLDLVLASCTPASPARTGSIVYPLVRGMIEGCKQGNKPVPSELGAYLILLIYMASMHTGAIFMTGMVPNVLNAKIAHELLGIDVSWMLWLVGAVPGLLSFLAVPWIVYRLCPPTLQNLDAFAGQTAARLAALPPMAKKEYLAAGVFLMVLSLWSTETWTGINTTWVGFLGVSFMLCFNIVEWKDISAASGIWSLLTWFGAIMGFSTAMMQTGFFRWFTQLLSSFLYGVDLPMPLLFLLLALLASIPHYLFASLSAYAVSFGPMLFSFIAVMNIPPYPAFFLASFLMVISSCLTHYGNALGPMLMGTGMVGKGVWWRCGLLLTLFQIFVYLTVGLLYWHWLGLW